MVRMIKKSDRMREKERKRKQHKKNRAIEEKK